MKKGREHTSTQAPSQFRFIFPTEEKALVWAKRAAHWQRRTVYVVKCGSRQFEIVKAVPTREHFVVTQMQEVTKIETNGGLNHE
jgi:hypothetical protein